MGGFRNGMFITQGKLTHARREIKELRHANEEKDIIINAIRAGGRQVPTIVNATDNSL